MFSHDKYFKVLSNTCANSIKRSYKAKILFYVIILNSRLEHLAFFNIIDMLKLMAINNESF